MIWHEITIRTTEEAVEMISNFFHERGAGGVAIEESGSLDRPRDTSLGQWYELPLNDIPDGEAIVQAYYPDMRQTNDIIEQLHKFVEEIRAYPVEAGSAEITVRQVKEDDWADAWKQYFKPVAITERLTIKPTWEKYEAKPREIVIELDPGMAFGTGTHATTSLCLQTLEKVVRPGMHVIDIGTGSGILAITAARMGAERVLALDLDPVAVSSAGENVRLNGLEQRVTVMQSDLLQALKKGTVAETGDNNVTGTQFGVRLPVQLVVANILAEIIVLFIDDVYQVLAPGGIYIASGIIERKAAEVTAALQKAGFAVVRTEIEGEWAVIVAAKG